MIRVRPLTLAVIALALTSALLTLALGTRQPGLLIAQLIGNTAQALLGIEFLRRRALRVFGWILLALATVTFALLGETAVRLLAR